MTLPWPPTSKQPLWAWGAGTRPGEQAQAGRGDGQLLPVHTWAWVLTKENASAGRGQVLDINRNATKGKRRGQGQVAPGWLPHPRNQCQSSEPLEPGDHRGGAWD